MYPLACKKTTQQKKDSFLKLQAYNFAYSLEVRKKRYYGKAKLILKRYHISCSKKGKKYLTISYAVYFLMLNHIKTYFFYCAFLIKK